MSSPSSCERELLSFPAASALTVIHHAWLPPKSRLSSSELRDAALGGLSSIEPGELRESALASFQRGAIEIGSPSPHASLGWPTLIDINGHARAAGVTKWNVVEVSVAGQLDERMIPLWASLAAARGIARSVDGLTSDAARSRLHSRASVALAVEAQPAFVLADHVMLLSSSDHRDRGRITTIGMYGLGVPELELKDVPARAVVKLGTFMNGLAWKVLRLALSTPHCVTGREVRRPDEIEIHQAHCDAACGRPPRATIGGDSLRGRVRLSLAWDAGGGPWLALDPPRSFVGGRAKWALS